MEDNCRINRWELLKQHLNNLTPEAFKTKMLEKDVVLIDCRQPNEFEYGHLPNALSMDYFGAAFYDQLEGLEQDKTYLVYCRSGRRSLRTCTLMQNSGFERVYNLEGGLKVWFEVFGQEGLVLPKVNEK